ncbi:MAG: hypothetical protein ACRETF_06980 [Nevskiaceae bacterium]
MTPLVGLGEFLIALHPTTYFVVVCGAVMLFALLAWYAFQYLRWFRLFEDTPTSRVQTAAQGFVELEGRVSAIGTEPLHSPLRRVPCVWYSMRVEELETGIGYVGDTGLWGLAIAAALFILHLFEVRRTGKLVREESSGEFFLIRDPTGTCLVDPQDAHVVGAKTKVWTIGAFRYEEAVIAVGDPIYALGLFRTHREHVERSERQEITDLISDWKLDQARLVARFDANRDGTIDQREWEVARAAAAEEVRSRRLRRGAGPELHLLCRPRDRRPFVLSLLRQQRLINHHWFRSVMCTLGALIVGTLIAWSNSVRPLW